MNKHKLLEKFQSGSKNLRFDEFVTLIEAFGFRLDRIRGSHQIYVHPKGLRALNIQSNKGQAKPVQVKGFLKIIAENDLKLED